MLATTTYVRDRFTWLAYAMLGYYAYLMADLGPLMPFLRDELDLPEALYFTIGNLHFSAFAFGMMTAGLLTDRIAARWGRRITFWGGGAGMALGAVMLTLGRHPAVTIGAALVMGTIGSLLLVTIQATLSDRHGERRAIALTESNILASVCAALAPVLVGGFEGAGVGWRMALYVGVIAWALLAVGAWREPLPDDVQRSNSANGKTSRRLPFLFWLYWFVVFLMVSVEWGIIANGADFLNRISGYSKTDAATLMSAFFVAMVVGRAAGSQLTRRIPAPRLLLFATILALIGFGVFWLSPIPILNVIGLFVTGLGVANLFPLTLTAAVSVAPELSSSASARVSFGSGTALLIAPLLIGGLADRIGIHSAYSVVGVFLLVGVGVIVYANRRAAVGQS